MDIEMPPMSLHLEVISWMVKTERDQVMERRLTSHRRRIPTAPAEELELDAPKDHASSDIHTNMYHHYQFQPSRMKL
jgi:hypothetical protein